MIDTRPRQAGIVFALPVVAMVLALAQAHAQTPLSAYTDANGYVDVQDLTCAQLAGTFQEDANFLGVWYSGWINGRTKKHMINVDRTKEGIHQVIVYCKDNPNKTIVEAIQTILSGK